MSDDDREGMTPSDLPADLSKERESFVRQFLRKGVELTESLIDENRDLRQQLSAAQVQVARLRAQVASDDAIRDLLRKIESLELERRELLARSAELEETSKEAASRNSEIEAELLDLANLYVASSHLLACRSPKSVLKHVRELLQQLVGAELVVIYTASSDGGGLHPLAAEGIEEGTILGPLVPGEGRIGEVLMTGVPRIVEGRLDGGSLEEPVAVIPLTYSYPGGQQRTIGVIAVATVFAQKERWEPVDRELFKLLGAHGGNALISAHLRAEVEGPDDALRVILSRSSLPPPPPIVPGPVED
jgi:hypothetical protein